MNKVYEIAVMQNNLPIKIYEYTNFEDCVLDLYGIIHRYKEYDTIEISTQEQTAEGENENTYTWATINIKEFLKGDNI